MSFILAVLVSLAGFVLTASVSAGPADPLPIRNLARGPFSGIKEAKEEIIKDEAAWEKVWSHHMATRQPPEKLPEVNFAKEMVIVVTMGRQMTGGYAVEITKVEPVEGKLRVAVARKKPAPGAMTTQALTAPFHMVAVPKTDLKPEFVEGKAPPARKKP